MEKLVNKIMMVSFVAGAALCYYIVNVTVALLSNSWGAFARLTDSPAVRHGAPLTIAVVFFFYISFSKNIRSWAHEVIMEVSKVVWPSRRETTAMTVVVCFFMIMTGIILGIFDFISSQVIQFIIEMG